MIYQIKCNFKKIFIEKSSNGFTLLELLVVIGIFLLLFAVSDSTFLKFKSHNNLEIATGGVIEGIRLAQSSAQSGKGNSKWGAEIISNSVVVFKGNTYATRDTTADQNISFSGGISASGLSEVVFEKITGITGTTGTIILTNGTDTKNININAKGTVTY